ncbi:ankyrin [Mycena belliarum]|uniref:Ankyrin n=1 Tax=Mycena belliarum TaxID=1033014 RepID=A0AAD6XZP9_9AGAR|nr:ankyrin [Mycena belliae]
MASVFDAAAAYLSTSPSASNLPSSTKLELYGLFKYITVSTTPTTPRPSIFDFTGRAKWDAWSAASNTYSTKADAEGRYLEVARSLGWTEGVVLTDTASTEAGTENWDSDDDDSPINSRGEPGGFGTSVSSMAQPEEEIDNSVHGLAVSNNLQGLASLLQGDPSVDLNARDPFGYTALHLAADRGHVPVVKFLLERNVDRDIKDEDDFTAAELAQAAGHETIVQLLGSSTG